MERAAFFSRGVSPAVSAKSFKICGVFWPRIQNVHLTISEAVITFALWSWKRNVTQVPVDGWQTLVFGGVYSPISDHLEMVVKRRSRSVLIAPPVSIVYSILVVHIVTHMNLSLVGLYSDWCGVWSLCRIEATVFHKNVLHLQMLAHVSGQR